MRIALSGLQARIDSARSLIVINALKTILAIISSHRGLAPLKEFPVTYRSVVVDLNEVETIETLVNVARALEEGHRAHIIGVHRVPTVDVQYQIAPFIPPELLRNLNAKHLKNAQDIHDKFLEVAGADDNSYVWHQHTGRSMTDVSDGVREAMTADLIITSQLSHVSAPWLQRELMERSGAPVMVVPEDLSDPVFDDVTIAWSGAAHTSRAVRDAMPVLERSKRVSVIRVGAEAREDAHVHSGYDVVAWLEHHGCNVVLEPNDPARVHAAGATLVDHVKDLGSGMLIAGGYGHSRFYDNVLGGMTDDIIKHAKIPVFLAH